MGGTTARLHFFSSSLFVRGREKKGGEFKVERKERRRILSLDSFPFPLRHTRRLIRAFSRISEVYKDAVFVFRLFWGFLVLLLIFSLSLFLLGPLFFFTENKERERKKKKKTSRVSFYSRPCGWISRTYV